MVIANRLAQPGYTASAHQSSRRYGRPSSSNAVRRRQDGRNGAFDVRCCRVPSEWFHSEPEPCIRNTRIRQNEGFRAWCYSWRPFFKGQFVHRSAFGAERRFAGEAIVGFCRIHFRHIWHLQRKSFLRYASKLSLFTIWKSFGLTYVSGGEEIRTPRINRSTGPPKPGKPGLSR